MGVVIWLQKVEGIGMARKGVESEVVSGIDSVSEPFETGGGGRDEVWSNCADLGDAEHTVVSSFKRASVWVVIKVVKLE